MKNEKVYEWLKEQGYLIGSIPLVLTGVVMILLNLVVMISRGSIK